MDDYRETIWGIRPEDRAWFQLLTLVGGTVGSVVLTLLELEALSGDAAAGVVARNVVLGIGGSFVASGFIAWGMLQAKEMMMSMSGWIRDATERRRERWRQEREEAVAVAVAEARRESEEEARRQVAEARRESEEEARRQVAEARREAEEARRQAYIQGYADSREGKPEHPPGGNGVDGGEG